MFQWITIFLGITAIGCLGVGLDQVRQFNNSCTEAGIPLAQCWPQALQELK